MLAKLMDSVSLVQTSESILPATSGGGRRVLVISYNWPPDSSIGGVRPVKLVEQLKVLGWEPVILTVRERYYEQLDSKLIDSVAGSVVIRTRCLLNIPRLYVSLRAFFARLLNKSKEPFSIQHELGQPTQRSMGLERSGKIRRIVLSLFYTPDENIGWLPFGLWSALNAVRQYGVTCIISTGPPFTAHILALLTSAVLRVPWISDFRDPWALSEMRPVESTSAVSDWVNTRIEGVVVRRADRVVCVTPAMTQWYRERYPELPSGHWETIMNGFSASEFSAVADIHVSAKFRVSYLGSIEYERTPELLFHAVRDLCREGVMRQQDVEIRLVGKCQEVRGQSMAQLIATYELNDIVTMVSSVPRHEALKEMRQAHVLLLLAPSQRLQIPGKAYEYIGASRHILAVTEPDGATANVIRNVGGVVVSQDNLEEMKRVLESWYREFQCGWDPSLKSSQSDLTAAEFEWTRLGIRYARLLTAVS